MEIKKISEYYNPIFKRKESSFFIDHTSQSSPKLHEVRKNLAEKYNVNENILYVIKMDTRTGTNQTHVNIEIYDSSEIAEKVVPKHIQMRNSPSRRNKKK